MLDIPFFYIALIGSGLAGLIDLKTTEIPDQIPYIMAIIGILGYSFISYSTGSYLPIMNSCIVGLVFLGFGFLMYYTGQWGGGDAKLLSAIGFLLPYVSFPLNHSLFNFPITYFINVFLVGTAYMIVYILILSIIRRDIWTAFFKKVRQESRKVLKINSALICSFIFFSIFSNNYYGYSYDSLFSFGLITIFGVLGFYLFFRFAKTVETVGFKMKVPIKKLRVGDVLDSSKVWDGITEKELKKLQKSDKKHVMVKDGVRFGPSFLLALLFTYYYGDAVVWIMENFVFA